MTSWGVPGCAIAGVADRLTAVAVAMAAASAGRDHLVLIRIWFSLPGHPRRPPHAAAGAGWSLVHSRLKNLRTGTPPVMGQMWKVQIGPLLRLSQPAESTVRTRSATVRSGPATGVGSATAQFRHLPDGRRRPRS